MFLCRCACLFVLGIAAAGCGDTTTSVKVNIDAPGLTVSSLEIAFGWDGKTERVASLPPMGGSPNLPGSVILVLPDMDKLIEVEVQAVDNTGGMLMQGSSIQSHSHQEVSLSITLAQPVIDLALSQDLSQPQDLAGVDLTPPDLANADFASTDLRTPPDLGPHNPLVQMGPIATGGATVTATLSKPSRSGTLLVFATAFNYAVNPGAPSNWTGWQADSLYNNVTIVYLPINFNGGGITSVSMTQPKPAPSPSPVVSIGQLAEFDTFTTADADNWCWNSNGVTAFPCTTTTATTHDQELGVNVASEILTSSGSCTFSPSGGFMTIGDNGATVSNLHFQFGYAIGLPNGMPASETVTSSTSGYWAGVVVSFH
jgi:hypothetical protein